MARRGTGERLRRAWRHYRLLAVRRWRRPLIERRLAQSHFRVADSLIVSGMARGGTSWLFELLSQLPGVVPNWEPLNGPNATNLARLTIGEPGPGEVGMADLLTLRERGGWQTDYIRLRQLRRPQRVLTKFVRAAGLLPAVLDELPLRYRPVVLLRHPIATADSYGRAWGHLEQFRNWRPEPARAYGPLFREHARELQAYESSLEFRTAVWCLHHRWLLDRPALRDGVLIVRYEDLVIDPVTTLDPVLAHWAPDLDRAAFLAGLDLRRPSSTDFAGALVTDPGRQISKYRRAHPAELIDRCEAIMERFGWGQSPLIYRGPAGDGGTG